MKVSKLGEFQLIERIKRAVGGNIIGSDTAPIALGNTTYLATCDILLEGSHFLRKYPPEAVGFKAISINVSDIVASGGQPKFVLVSLMLPNLEVAYVDRLYKGLLAACRHYRCQIIGGNITRSEKIGIDVFMIGQTKKFVGRAAPTPGQFIFVTGPVGDSRAGLELLSKKKSRLEGFEKILVERHLVPKVDLKIGEYVGTHAASSLDLSDGLVGDLYQLKGASSIKIKIEEKKIPLSKELLAFCKKYRYDPVKYALIGGEDYRVLFTQQSDSSPFQKIGTVEKGNGIYLDKTPLKNKGFDHFK